MLLLPPTVWFPTFPHLVYRCYVLSRAGKVSNCSIHSISSGMSSTCPSLMVLAFPEWWLLTILYFCTWDFSLSVPPSEREPGVAALLLVKSGSRGICAAALLSMNTLYFLRPLWIKLPCFQLSAAGRYLPGCCLVQTEGYRSQPLWPWFPANFHLVMSSLLPLPFPPLGMEYSNGNHIPRTNYLLYLRETTYSLSLNFFSTISRN